MPIKIGKRTFPKFRQAVRFIQQSKGLSKDRASAYVATIERNEHPKKKVRYRNG